MNKANKTLLLVGATGLVGRHVLQLALDAPRVGTVVAPTRRDLAAHAKLQSPQVDYDHLDDSAPWWRADAVICTLGTTIRKAGSQQAFYQVDHNYPLAVAKLAHKHGTPTYVLTSAIGANAQSRFFYSRVKGELENDLHQIGFQSLTIVQPSVIGGNRDEFRLGERVMLVALGLASPVLPRRWRVNQAFRIASTLLDAALNATPGVHVIGSEMMA